MNLNIQEYSVRQRNTSTIVYQIVRDICAENNNVATINSIYNRAIAKKIDELTVDEIIQQLRTRGHSICSENDQYSFA